MRFPGGTVSRDIICHHYANFSHLISLSPEEEKDREWD